MKKYPVLSSVFAIKVLVLWTLFMASATAQPNLSLTPVITGLSSPIQMVNAGDGSNRIFIVEKGGNIKVFSSGYASLGTFLTVTGLATSGEQGLLSMAFHPDYVTNGLFYVYYVTSGGDLQLARYNVSAGNPNQADVASKVVLLTIAHPGNTNHNGGELHFGKDGYLYLSTGDGGGGGDPNNNAQNTSVLLGKLLRMQVNTSASAPYYTIPPGNPFGNEVFAYGLRNPFRWGFDRIKGDIWIGDVGQENFEEFNYRPMATASGANFGWRCYEGNNVFNTSVGCGGGLPAFVFPVSPYVTQNPAASAIGGVVYRGYTYEAMKGYYIGADYFSGLFYKIKYDSLTMAWTTALQTLSPTAIADFGENEAGELFAVALSSGALHRVTATGQVNTTYVFTGNGAWSLASNWAGGVVPPSTVSGGAYVVIKPRKGGICNLDVIQTILADSYLVVEAGAQFNVNSNLNLIK